ARHTSRTHYLSPPTSSFSFHAPAPTHTYTLSLHDALPICPHRLAHSGWIQGSVVNAGDGTHEHPTQGLLDAFTMRRHLAGGKGRSEDTRLNSSHVEISYAVFCLKKKKKIKQTQRRSVNKT